MINLKEGTSVFTHNGEEAGKVNRFILDPATNEVTHIVVQKGWLLPEDKVVPFEMISAANEERLELKKDIGDLEQLPPFEETHFIGVGDDDINSGGQRSYRNAPAFYWYPPSGYIGDPVSYYGWSPVTTTRNIPDDTVPLKEGSDVMSSNGEHVGDIEQILVDPDSRQVTHFLISQGFLLRERKLVPAHWVRSIEEDKVQLAVSTQLLERLPPHDS